MSDVTKIVILLLLFPSYCWGQDIHFSQFFAAPLVTNPANTGNFTGVGRIGLNYKDQWGSFTMPYKTYALYTDYGIQPKGANNRFGLGILAVNDVAGDGQLTTTKLVGSAAYHIGFSPESSFRVSFGLNGGYIQKKLDLTKLTFGNQWATYNFDDAAFNGESNVLNQFNYLDFGAGVVVTFLPYINERYFIGLSALHITQPNESFYNADNALARRYTATAGAFFSINQNVKMQPQVFVSTQSKALEIIAGSTINFPIKNNDGVVTKSVFGGIWYRYRDAAWLLGGITFNNISISASYDFNVSTLQTASNYLGGFEMALVYVFNKKYRKDPLNCPAYE